MKHTPGPWEVQGSTVFAVNETERVDGYRVGIAQCGGELTPRAGFKYGDERDANAKLIAASPRMYDYIAMRAALCDNEAIQILKEIGYAESEAPKGRTAGYMGPRE